ncbi:MAG TPA: ABC transporter substrate-binding protein [Burkholderiales bacterium]|nr:ABC transporter substrate-binding protein [Burkholderiales bacterium]
MSDRSRFTRREFLGTAALVGTGALLGMRAGPAAAEPPPETTTLRLVQAPGICMAPQLVAEDLLRGEGFVDIQYVKTSASGIGPALISGEADLSTHFAAPLVLHLEAGDPLVILAGIHVGCFELFGTDRIRAVRDLKGKTIAVPELDVGPHLFISIMVAHVGLDPRKDIKWVVRPAAESMRLLAQGRIDAYLGFPPDPQELRARKIGHVVVSSSVDRPWSEYFCCLEAGNRDFVLKNPVATKRALRAILKAADICALQPERAAQSMVDKGFTPRYDYALQTLKDIPYGKWRERDPEDTLRFYALRLHEAGRIKSSPQKIIAQGTDWRFWKELKRELKA